MRVTTAFAAVFVFSLVAVSPLHAQYVEMYRLDKSAEGVSEQAALSALASHLGVSLDTLKQEQAQYKSGIGELYIAHQFARISRSDLKSMMSEKEAGKSWGTIAKDRDIDMDDVRKDVKKLEDTLKHSQ